MKKRILELDGLRAFAVLSVIIYHIVNFSGIVKVEPVIERITASFGMAGVYIFFVISGFIITSLLIREKQSKGEVSLTGFYLRRFFRIIPPLAVYLFTLFILNRVGYISVDPINFLYSSLFVSNIPAFQDLGDTSQFFFRHTWSLSVEEQYYLIFPPLLILIFGFNRKAVSILIIALFLLSLFSVKLAKELSEHIHPALMNVTILSQFRYIMMGVLLALHREKVKKVIAGTSIMYPFACINFIFFRSVTPLTGPINLLAVVFDVIACGLLVLWCVENPQKCEFLRWKSIQWIGACSYSIYLWQQLFTAKPQFYNGWSIAQTPFAIVAIMTCATLSHYLIEIPTIRLGQQLSRNWRERKIEKKPEIAAV